MIEEARRLARRGDRQSIEESTTANLPYVRAAVAQLFLATGAGATFEHVVGARSSASGEGGVPKPLAWAPALLAPLAAAAHLEHARRPGEQTSRAVRFLDIATLAVGSGLFIYDLVANRNSPARLAPLAFASAGILGITLEHQETETRRAEAALRRRARVIERLVPRRRPKLDRVVVHV
jgi:hypothetical protein